MAEKQFNKSDVIFRQGDQGDVFYQIIEGSVGIYANLGEEGEQEIAKLAAGDFFGEMAIIEKYPRSASAVALEDGTKVQEIGADETADYLEKQPENALVLMKHLASRLRELTKDYDEVQGMLDELEGKKEEAKSEDIIQLLKKHLLFGLANKRFEDVTSEEALRMSDAKSSDGFAKTVESYPKGTVIFKQGETGDCMYAIHGGSVGIFTDYGTPEEKKLTELTENTFFGEMGMITKEPHSATAVTLEDDTIVEIIRSGDFRELFEKNPPKAGMIINHFSYRLRKLTNDYLDALAKAAKYEK